VNKSNSEKARHSPRKIFYLENQCRCPWEVWVMKKHEFEYTIFRDNSPKMFKAACGLVKETFPDFHAEKLLIDVDGSTIQVFCRGDNEIIIYDDYDVGAVLVKSDVDLSRIFS
jgi:hypothetical protein